MAEVMQMKRNGCVEVNHGDRLWSKYELQSPKSVNQTTKFLGSLLEDAVQDVTTRVVDVLATYFWHSSDQTGHTKAEDWPGRKKFEGHAMHWIRLGQPVQMVLPAFPFKSSNPDKVSGPLPDFAEFLGLSRLNQMCLDVQKVYGMGAHVTVAADGVVFSDLLLISDMEVWNYGQAVRDMVVANGFRQNITVVHPMELLGMTAPETLTREVFFETSSVCRDRILAQFTRAEETMQALVNSDPDSRLTYSGMKAFCKVDQENSIYFKQAPSKKAFLRDMSSLALKMLARSEGFGKLIRERLPDHIRLSIHPSSGMSKLSICLLPQPKGCVARAPWMSCIAVDGQGNYISAHSKDVGKTHDLIYRDNKPWLFREHSDCYQVGMEVRKHWQLDHMYPVGVRVSRRAESIDAPGGDMKIPLEMGDKLRLLSEWQPVQLVS